MGSTTRIAWCDATFNPWRGCSAVDSHPGCLNCYARDMLGRPVMDGVKWGSDGTRVLSSKGQWDMVQRINRHAFTDGIRRRVFVGSLMDFFDDFDGPIVNQLMETLYTRDGEWCYQASPDTRRKPGGRPLTLRDIRADLLALFDSCGMIDFMVLTKRPHHVSFIPQAYYPNIWFGVTVSDQATWDAFNPIIGAVREHFKFTFASLEPMLESIYLSNYPYAKLPDQIIVGGESGGSARVFNVEWARSIKEQLSWMIPRPSLFIKQMGSNPIHSGRDPWVEKMRHKKGADPLEWNDEFRVQEIPE